MFVDTLFARARAEPPKVVLVYNGVACSYAGFARRIAEAHSLLRAQRLPAGSRAVLFMRSLAAAWVAGIAAQPLAWARLQERPAQPPFNAFPRAHFHCVNSMPRNRLGKVMRGELQAQLLGDGA